ncbi:MAG: CapA family protein [Deltaproteobacteria bacterium]|nr:CapA family protein [Deltaproteobacteria bacterium]
MRLLLGGDVMVGRGIDQILVSPGSPILHEDFIRDARDYVVLAERTNGPIPRAATPSHVWGAALEAFTRAAVDARIINVETSVTRSSEFWQGKGIHYRMSPANVGCLQIARPDVCGLANNHVMDFGIDGLLETLDVLERAGLRTAGAGRDLARALLPVRVATSSGALSVRSIATEDSGVPREWAAEKGLPGIALVSSLSARDAPRLAQGLSGDVRVISIHWGDNWGYPPSAAERAFAHALIDAGVDVVHGHSSHHPRPIEIYQGRLVLYGCGDLINDYEGIRGYEEFRSDLRLLYQVDVGQEGRLLALELLPFHAKRFSLEPASMEKRAWLASTLTKVGRPLGTSVELDGASLRLAMQDSGTSRHL